MAGRREAILDAAITVLGTAGMHGLTHRAVDAAAGLPAGSTSNHFRTRDALIDAVVERFAARERANWEELVARAYPGTPQELARALALFAREATGPQRTLTLARYAILVEAAIHPSLRVRLASAGRGVDAWARHWLRVAGSADPHRDTPIVLNHWTGIVLHQLAIPDPEFDPTAQIEALVTSVLRAPATEVPA